MKRFLLVLVLLSPAITQGAKFDDIMKEWIGKTREQVTRSWGYPMNADHVIRLGEVTVFTYEFGMTEGLRFGSFGSNGPCRIAFAFKDQKVVQNRWEGKFCPKLEPPT
jgi:hypothetical protein